MRRTSSQESKASAYIVGRDIHFDLVIVGKKDWHLTVLLVFLSPLLLTLFDTELHLLALTTLLESGRQPEKTSTYQTVTVRPRFSSPTGRSARNTDEYLQNRSSS